MIRWSTAPTLISVPASFRFFFSILLINFFAPQTHSFIQSPANNTEHTFLSYSQLVVTITLHYIQAAIVSVISFLNEEVLARKNVRKTRPIEKENQSNAFRRRMSRIQRWRDWFSGANQTWLYTLCNNLLWILLQCKHRWIHGFQLLRNIWYHFECRGFVWQSFLRLWMIWPVWSTSR